ncbi:MULTISPECIES: DUF6878 family protein [unclassified Acidocella]|uniref:DUF6878 family protein n=1 Tax=unclassified Acidocella TaxID=2648610 RepID=UPI0006846CE7|nr:MULTISPECIES: DUF6878 family protein [unclassified Acidocella]WBO59404.1 hypothetical protein GT370_00140 [Acidocella sp. MX-AZ03]
MSDNHNPTPGQQAPASPDAFLASWEQKERAYRERASAVLADNKKTLFGILAEHSITAVIVNFDGYGDSGQIEDITAQSGDVAVELPDERIEIFRPGWDSPDIERQTHTVREAIEALSYDFLVQTHCGWENNDGAYGDFTFDVTAGSITLDYNERYTATENYSHEF